MNAAKPGSPAGLREANRRRVLDAVLAAGEPTQSGIAAATGLAPATVSNIVRDLSREGRLIASTAVRGGRRVRAVRLAPVPGVVAGIDFGHRHVRVGLARAAAAIGPASDGPYSNDHNVNDPGDDESAPVGSTADDPHADDLRTDEQTADDPNSDGSRSPRPRPDRLLAECDAELPEEHAATDGLEVAAALLDRALAAAGVPRAELLAVGIGLPAPIDARTGAVGEPGILPGWVGIRAAALAGELLGLPVVVDNDALLGTMAERAWGALRDVDDGVYLKLSDGVGAGLVLGGRPYRGRTGTAGELGHVVVDDSGGPPGGAVCRCGNRGCLETWASTATVVGLLEPLLGAPLTVGEVVARARDGHAPSRRVLADTGAQVGRALGGLCSVLTPERVVVGGELAQADDLLLDPMRAALDRWALPGAAENVQITTAGLGAHTHVLGAVALALDHVLSAAV